MRSRKNHILALFLSAIAAAAAQKPGGAAAHWRARPERTARMAQMAQRHGLTQASASTVGRLNQRFGSTLSASQVYYTTWKLFTKFAHEAKSSALGAAYVDHGAGAHALIVVGDRLRDSIDPGFTTVFQNGRKTRDQSFLDEHNTAYVFALWDAPAASLSKVGLNTEAAVRNHEQCGMNCVSMVNGNLWSEAHMPHLELKSPFLNLRAQGWPHEAAESIFGATPDIVIQVVDDGSYQVIRSNHEGHLIAPWHKAYP